MLERVDDQQVDDKGTDQAAARNILATLRNDAFDGNDDKLAEALGRPLDHVTGMINGTETIDDDVVMKARGIALHRGIELEEEPEDI